MKTHNPISQHIIEDLVQAALASPSGDNMQPFDYTYSHSTQMLSIFHCLERAEHVLNMKYFSDMISLGGVFENIRLRSSKHGLQPIIKHFFSPGTKVADIYFVSSNSPPDPLASEIFNRHTDRRNYHPNPLPTSILSKLETSSFPGIQCHVITKLDEITKTMAQNELLPWVTANVHRDLIKWVFWRKSDIGMPVSSLGLSIFDLPAFALMQIFWCSRWLMRLGGSVVITMKKRRALQSSSALILWSGEHKEDHYIEVGRQAIHIWTALNAHGFGAQPETLSSSYAGCYEFATQKLSLTDQQRDNLKATLECLREQTGDKNLNPLWMLRVGKTKSILPLKHRSSRRGLNKMLKFED